MELTTTNFADIYAGDASAAVSVPEATYDVRVADARVGKAESRTIFLDLEILNGPAQGKVAQVSLYVPDASNRGAVYHYQNKTRGFRSPEFFAALQALGDEPLLETLLETIANYLVGRTAVAELSLQKGGQYDGQNQLDSTRPLGTPLTEAVAAPAQVAAPAPVAAEPVTTPATEAAPTQEVPF